MITKPAARSSEPWSEMSTASRSGSRHAHRQVPSHVCGVQWKVVVVTRVWGEVPVLRASQATWGSTLQAQVHTIDSHLKPRDRFGEWFYSGPPGPGSPGTASPRLLSPSHHTDVGIIGRVPVKPRRAQHVAKIAKALGQIRHWKPYYPLCPQQCPIPGAGSRGWSQSSGDRQTPPGAPDGPGHPRWAPRDLPAATHKGQRGLRKLATNVLRPHLQQAPLHQQLLKTSSSRVSGPLSLK